MAPRYLTKSRCKIGLECPTKLFYTKKIEYFDRKKEDEFLQSLAKGGFQVGELAKLYYPGGVNIDELDYEISLARTRELLQQPEAIIYEAAFLYDNFFVRTDILLKKGNSIQLIEVKAKSFDPGDDSFVNKKGTIDTDWAPYLYDAAFQKFVVGNSYPAFSVSAYLLLADKSKRTTVDGLNQKFVIYTVEGRSQVKVKGPVDAQALGEKILTLQNIDDIAERIYQGTDQKEPPGRSFKETIYFFAEQYAADHKVEPILSKGCGSCEFRMEQEDPASGLRSGFHECWREKAGFSDADFGKPSVLDIWNFKKKDDCIRQGIYFQDKKIIDEFGPKKPSPHTGPGLSGWERQKLQITKSANSDTSHYIDIPALTEMAATWQFPYHFIDFETTAVAIPFTRGRRPYESVAFQFSHHILQQDGSIEHKGQWICAEPGVFPNFEFVRALKKELSSDDGTIFRYAGHENIILNAVYSQLRDSGEEDKDLLCNWIKEITHSGKDSPDKWKGNRDMVDLKEVIRQFYYSPLTKGSISIKKVLPAVLGSCPYLQEKYSQPIYGTGIKSLNFTDQRWIQFNPDGTLINPYQLLPLLGPGIGEDSFIDEDMEIADGGAAMTAYAKMQFTEMQPAERERIVDALLKYCELDTFAMVLLWEGLSYWLRAGG